MHYVLSAYINIFQSTVFAGDCSTNYIEIKTGSETGRVIKKICSGTSANFRTFSNQIFIKFMKGTQTSSFDGTWTTEGLQCCSKVMLENHGSRNGEYQWKAESKVYEEVGASSDPELIYRSVRSDAGPVWAVGPSPTSAGLYSTDIATCPEYIRGNWKYYTGSE